MDIAASIQDNWFEAECFNGLALVRTSLHRMDEAIEVVLSKQDGNGRWKQENHFAGRFVSQTTRSIMSRVTQIRFQGMSCGRFRLNASATTSLLSADVSCSVR